MSERDDRDKLDETGRERSGADARDVRPPDEVIGAPASFDGERALFDDERLLAFALGLADDPGLASAAAADETLARRIAALRADAAAVAGALERVVPCPPDDYTDLGAGRWAELRSFVRAPTPPATRRRPGWLRVLAPAAAVALVLVAGVVGLQRLGGEEVGKTSGTDTASKAAESYDAGDRAPESATERAQGAGGATPVPGRGAPDAAAYGTVVVARAGASADGRQTFAVLRVLKGQADSLVILEVTDGAAPPGTLQVLYLEPAPDGASATAPPTPSVAGRGSPPEGAGAVRAFRYADRPALALELPDGTDPAAVTLP